MSNKSWSFTLNNYTEQDCQLLDNIECNYIIYGKEVGESGTPHLQGTIVFKKTCRMAALKKILPTAHLEVTKSLEASINYCMKDKDFKIRDNRTQGKRTDLETIVASIKSDGLKKAIDDHPEAYVRFHAGMEKLAFRCQKPRDPKVPPVITWLYGPTGTGKTRAVFEKEPDLWISGRDLKWWDGYKSQEAVLIDDFRKDFCTFHELLRILDRYPYNVQVKGGFRVLNAKRIYVTSCYHPKDVYDTREDIGQLLRRLTFVTEVKKYNSPSVTDVTEVVQGNTILEPEYLETDSESD